MTALTAASAPVGPKASQQATRPAAPQAPRHPSLRLVRNPVRQARRLPFVLVVVLLLALGLVGVLLLSMQRAGASFALTSLQAQQAGLDGQVQALRSEVAEDQDPSVLAARAQALGMVAGVPAGYLGATGKVLGVLPSGAPVPAAGASAVDGIVVAGTALPPPVPAVPRPATSAVPAKATATATARATATATAKATTRPTVAATPTAKAVAR